MHHVDLERADDIQQASAYVSIRQHIKQANDIELAKHVNQPVPER
jgi:hypothetical protein